MKLTNRQTEIAKLICYDQSNPVIARKLNVSLRTVERERAGLYKLFKVDGPAGFVKAWQSKPNKARGNA